MHPDAPLLRITTWLAIAGYAVVASGLPLPVGRHPDAVTASRLAAKDRSRPFPCMDKPCGCATAEQCFTSCCCNTPAQTLAWAKAHAVEPAVLAALEHRVAGGGRARTRAERAACCSSKAPSVEEACCKAKQATSVACDPESPSTVCRESVAIAAPKAVPASFDESPSDDPSPSPQPRHRTVTLRAMLACGGIVADWFAAGAALPPPRVELSPALAMLDACTPGDESCASPASSPAAPPPRAA
ncbi:MAG: hypothetical protein EBX36_11425 [Planctomycetia bacterium]|nr:hypothetical protein [Planctomycetia bacterium]